MNLRSDCSDRILEALLLMRFSLDHVARRVGELLSLGLALLMRQVEDGVIWNGAGHKVGRSSLRNEFIRLVSLGFFEKAF